MKTTIFNEKIPRCRTCKYHAGVYCLLYEYIKAPIVFDEDFCGEHSNFEEDE